MTSVDTPDEDERRRGEGGERRSKRLRNPPLVGDEAVWSDGGRSDDEINEGPTPERASLKVTLRFRLSKMSDQWILTPSYSLSCRFRERLGELGDEGNQVPRGAKMSQHSLIEGENCLKTMTRKTTTCPKWTLSLLGGFENSGPRVQM